MHFSTYLPRFSSGLVLFTRSLIVRDLIHCKIAEQEKLSMSISKHRSYLSHVKKTFKQYNPVYGECNTRWLSYGCGALQTKNWVQCCSKLLSSYLIYQSTAFHCRLTQTLLRNGVKRIFFAERSSEIY